jgi:hypothetical protein
VFIAYGKELQHRATLLGFQPCGYRAVPGITRAIVRAPGGKVIKVNAHQSDEQICHDMWLGTLKALGIPLDDPMGASFRLGQDRVRSGIAPGHEVVGVGLGAVADPASPPPPP